MRYRNGASVLLGGIILLVAATRSFGAPASPEHKVIEAASSTETVTDPDPASGARKIIEAARPGESAHAEHLANEAAVVAPHGTSIVVDHSGRKEKGKASYYGKKFHGKTMADGNRMNPNAQGAASRSLPLGSTAKVTNLNNGKSTTVKIEDRGPFGDGRLIDVTPKAAKQLDMKKNGVAPVVVAPVTVPQIDGTVTLGAGAATSAGSSSPVKTPDGTKP